MLLIDDSGDICNGINLPQVDVIIHSNLNIINGREILTVSHVSVYASVFVAAETQNKNAHKKMVRDN